MAAYDQFLQKSLSKYRYPDLAERELRSVCANFTDLRPKMADVVCSDETTKSLLQLDGTIPVSYKGSVYNIPICIWLMDTHPYNPPLVYVRPTSNMQIKVGRNVDQDGKVDLPYLREWRYPKSDLLGLIQMLSMVFGEEPPVYSKSQTQQKHPQQEYLPSSPASVPNVTGKSTATEASLVSADEDRMKWLIETLTEAQYRNPHITTRDVGSVVLSFRDLIPKMEEFVFNDGTTKSLLQLDGTIPVNYKGTVFNIPICMWLMDTHPYKAPLVYARPTSSMHIKVGRNVDLDGKVDLQYLREWQYPNSDLLGLIQILTIEFGDEPPVYSKNQPQQRYPQQGHPPYTPEYPLGI